MEICVMELAYCRQIAEIEKQSFSTPWSLESIENELKLSYAVYYVAKEGEEILGYIGVHNIFGEGEITTLAVNPMYRRRGVADKLFVHFLQEEKKMGIKLINLEVRSGNEPAKSLYKKYGFSEVGVRKKYYQNPTEDALLMTLNII